MIILVIEDERIHVAHCVPILQLAVYPQLMVIDRCAVVEDVRLIVVTRRSNLLEAVDQVSLDKLVHKHFLVYVVHAVRVLTFSETESLTRCLVMDFIPDNTASEHKPL